MHVQAFNAFTLSLYLPVAVAASPLLKLRRHDDTYEHIKMQAFTETYPNKFVLDALS